MGEALSAGSGGNSGVRALLAPRGDSGGQPVGCRVPGSCPEHAAPHVSMWGAGQLRPLIQTESPFDTEAALVPGQSRFWILLPAVPE